MDIYDFTPIQYPADDQNSAWMTTHFDFHSIHDNVLKLDILGHDDSTMIRMLQDLSGIDPKTIPVDDKEVMQIFSTPESLGVTEDEILCKTGTFGYQNRYRIRASNVRRYKANNIFRISSNLRIISWDRCVVR
ncbi:hypothetical protein UM582_12385 [Staphylococcus aureus]|nr:hypothetical protein UM582_12385 [Staphylococcus aureus]